MLFCMPSCKRLFFPYIPAWNHTLVVCSVISFGTERRQENFLSDGLKGSVHYAIWVTRTMSDQSAVRWKKVTAQPEQDEFSHLLSGKRQAETSPVKEQPQVTGSKQLGQSPRSQSWKQTAWFLFGLVEALLLRLVSSSYQENQKMLSGQKGGRGGGWHQLWVSISQAATASLEQCLHAMCKPSNS